MHYGGDASWRSLSQDHLCRLYTIINELKMVVKLKKLLILWRKGGGEIGGERKLERKQLIMCLERQEGRERKTRYRICLEESKERFNGMREWKFYSVIILDGWGARIGVVRSESWKEMPNQSSNRLEFIMKWQFRYRKEWVNDWIVDSKY